MSHEKTIEIKNEITPEIENCVSKETLGVICNSRCKICSSPYLKEIHDLKKAVNHLNEIVKIIHDKFNVDISTASLSRHFKNYQNHKNLLSAKIINNDLIEEATSQAIHTKKLVRLIDRAFKMIEEKIKSGMLFLDVSDLEKLMKLRYQVLSGQDTDENDILAIFQKASNKYGLNLQQGVLFDTHSMERAKSNDGARE